MTGDQFRWEAQELALRLIAIGHESFQKNLRGSWDIRQAVGQQSPGTGLGGGEARSGLPEQTDDHLFHGFVILGDEMAPNSGKYPGLDLIQNIP